MSTSTLALSIVISFLLFAILVGYAVMKLTYRNHHYPPPYYPPAGGIPPPEAGKGGGGNTLLGMIFLIIITIILALMAVNGAGGEPAQTQDGSLEFVRFQKPRISSSYTPEPEPDITIPQAYDRPAPRKEGLADLGDRNRRLPPPPKQVYPVERVEAPLPEIKPTYGFRYTCSPKAGWAESKAKDLRKKYPDAKVVYVAGGDYPYKIILYSSTLEADVASWRQRRPDIKKGWVIPLPQ